MYSSTNQAVYILMFSLISLAVTVPILIALCKIMQKFNEAWWKGLIPLYNYFLICKHALGNGWFIIGMMLPIVCFVVNILLAVKLAKGFGYGIGLTLVLIFLQPLGYLFLGFNSTMWLGD